MKLLKEYFSSTLGHTFFPIFFTLYAITSIITLVKIASLTSVITMDFTELLYIYTLNIPLILLYTLPITYFISIVLNISKLSSEYEMIVLTSFGLSPMKILKFIAPISFLLTTALLILTFVTIPQVQYLEKKFINTKKQNAQFNIKPSEYGQKFGPWYIYVEKKIENGYHNITLLQPTNEDDTIILSKEANIKNNVDSLTLNLFNGSALVVGENIKQINFNKMTMNNHLPKTKQVSSISDLIQYWSDVKTNGSKLRILMENVFLSTLPLISIVFYIALGYFNPRYQKNRSTIYSISLVVIYVVAMNNFAAMKNPYFLIILPSIWILLSFYIYKVRIKPYY